MIDLGLKQNPAKSTMSDGNRVRSYIVFEDIYYQLIRHYRHTLTDKRDRISVRQCTEPTKEVKKIYDLLKYKHVPFTKRKSVVLKSKFKNFEGHEIPNFWTQ